MSYKGLKEYITVLKNSNELIEIQTFVNPLLEIAEFTDRVCKTEGGGKAILFTNTGTAFPILMNSLGSHNRICKALGVSHLDEFTERIHTLFKTMTAPKQGFLDKLKVLPKLGEISSWMPESKSGKGKCQEVVMTEPDLTQLPILQCWPGDAGRFITLPLVHTVDPQTNIRNVGMYRMQVFLPNMTGMHWHRHKVGARHYDDYKKLGKRMPIAVAIGGDPVYTYCATAPLPDNVDEYMLAGFIRKEKVKLVKCLTQNLEVPEDVDFVIEGYIDVNEEKILEGPFGDHTGFYSLPDYYPKFHITCITHRRDAVYPSTIVGIPPMEDAWIAKATERLFIAPIQLTMVPELLDMDLPFHGVAHNLAIVKINKTYPGQAVKVMNSFWGAGQMMLNKTMVVLDDNTKVTEYLELTKSVLQNLNTETDFFFSKGPLDVLDHAADRFSFGGKVGIDATHKHFEEIVESNIDKNIAILNLTEIVTKVNSTIQYLAIVSGQLSSESNKNFLTQFITSNNNLSTIKVLVLVDETVDISKPEVVCWVTLNNIDPGRDISFVRRENQMPLVVINGTSKINHADFKRDWPNIIISDDKTIAKVDVIWKENNMEQGVESPSLTFKNMVATPGAYAHHYKSDNNK